MEIKEERNMKNKKIIFSLIIFNFIAAAIGGNQYLAAQANPNFISPEDARNHIGENVTVRGRVEQVYHSARSNTYFLNMGGVYPNNSFTAVIRASDLPKFEKVDINKYSMRIVEVKGTIVLYRNRPEIVLLTPTQITLCPAASGGK